MPNLEPTVRHTPEEWSSIGSVGSGYGSDQAVGDTTGSGFAVQQGQGSGVGEGAGDSPIPGDKVDQPPVLIWSTMPEYPEAARRKGIEGVVVLRIVVNKEGSVERDVTVVQSISMLDRAAIEAVRRWRFSPGHNDDGSRVRVELEVPLRFELRSEK